jgi:hypothetical protein
MEERIAKLEKLVGDVPGTILQRVIGPAGGMEWVLGVGALLQPKHFFYGKTISAVLEQAERQLLP